MTRVASRPVRSRKPARAGLHHGLELVQATSGDPEVNLDYAATTPALMTALDAVIAFLPDYGSVHRGGGRRSELSTSAYESARATVGRFVGVPPGGSVIFVRNTTEAANLLAAALPAGSRVLCSPFEHHANLLPWRLHRVAHLPFTESAARLLEVIEATLAAGAKEGSSFDLLAISGASNVTGEVPPIDAISAVAHRYGTRVFVDAAQLAPHRRIDMEAAGVDFLAFSGHKLYAPFAAGALALRADQLGDGLPLLRGGGAVRLVGLEDVAWSDPPHRYEAGTPNTVGAVALAAACEALRGYDMARVADEERRLARRLWEGLGSIRGVQLLRMWDEAPDRVGVATFSVEGQDPRAVAQTLASRFGIAVRSGAFCAHPLVAHLLGLADDHIASLFEELRLTGAVEVPGAVRASIGIGVTEEDIDGLLAAVDTIARLGGDR